MEQWERELADLEWSARGEPEGIKLCFKGRTETLESLFGSDPISPSVMTRQLWEYIKQQRLSRRVA